MIQLDPWLQGHMLSFDEECDPDHVSCFRSFPRHDGSFPVMPDRFLVSTRRNRCVETKKRQRQEAPADFSVGAVESVALGYLLFSMTPVVAALRATTRDADICV